MRSVLHKGMAVCMALVVLCTTMSFTINTHYCGSFLVDININFEASSCGMDPVNELSKTKTSCEVPIISKQSCCSDQQIIKQAQEDLRDSFNPLNLEHQIFVTALFLSYHDLFEESNDDGTTFKAYSPPFIERDFQALHETFLI